MRIVHINSTFNSGSTGRIVYDIHAQLVQIGVESFVFYGRGKNIDRKNIVKIGSKYSQAVHGLLTRIFDMHGYGSMYATICLVRDIEKLSPDIVHLHNIHGYYLNYRILLNYLSTKQIKVFWTLHDCWAFTGHCSYFDIANCYKWKTHCSQCPQKKEYPSSYVFDNSYTNFEIKISTINKIENLHLITPSKWLADKVAESKIKYSSLRVINNGIDTSSFRIHLEAKQSLGFDLTKFLILGVANIWDRRKGLEYFDELSMSLRHNELIVIVGNIKGYDFKDNKKIVHIPRTESKEQLALVYSSADVYVNPTLEDNYPTTNLEALACGTPVITFDTGGSGEVINSTNGLVVEKGNFECLRDSIDKIKAMYDSHSINRKLISEDARFKYSIEAFTAKFQPLYESMI